MSDFSGVIAGLSPEKLAALQQRLRKPRGQNAGAPRIVARDRNELVPLSFAQERLWFLNCWKPDDPTYNIPSGFRLTGLLDPDALRDSLSAIVQRHEVLRTVFVEVDGVPHQALLPSPADPGFQVIDLQDAPAAERSGLAEQILAKEARRTFDLAQGPLLRAVLLRLNPEEHWLLLVTHHIVSDGWSHAILVREFEAFYAALHARRPATLPALPLQYGDFAIWQREWLKEHPPAKEIATWQAQLAGVQGAGELFTDRPRPAEPTMRGAREDFVLPAPLVLELRRLAVSERSTLFMTLLAGLFAVLHRYIGEEELVVGTPSAARDLVELENLIGTFINMLPLRVSLAQNPSFRELLARVRTTVLGALTHQSLPLEMLVQELHLEREVASSPLFRVMFAFESTPPPVPSLSGLVVTPFVVDTGTAKFDLSLTVVDTGDELAGAFEYNCDLFDAATVQRMARHWERLMTGAARRPDCRLRELPLLSPGEEAQFTRWNATQAAQGAEAGVHQWFAAQAARTPDLPAAELAAGLSGQGVRMTYAELNRAANRLAHYLRTLGVGPDVPVGLCTRRSLGMLVGLLAILKAGGAYVPIDPDYPKERQRFMLDTAGAMVLLVEPGLEYDLPAQGAQIAHLDLTGEILAHQPDHDPDNRVSAQHLAYVLFTSGSTGMPKGVQVSHGALCNFLRAMGDVLALSPQDRFLAVTSLAFDIAALELLLPLVTGATVVLYSGAPYDGALLAEVLAGAQITALQATPVTWRLLLDAGWRGDPGMTLLCGGEALSPDLAAQLLAAGKAVWNLYGPTETTVWSCLHRVDVGAGPVPIGRPIANTQIHILDGYGQRVPVGIPGELYIGGAGLARCYVGRPDLTAEHYLPDPWSPAPGARMYRTGDRARYRQDGSIEYLGRVDRQIKVRGWRIEPREIEVALDAHPAVLASVVVARADVAREDGGGERQLIAYVVPGMDPPPTTGSLRDWLKGRLPGYMVPGVYVFLAALPLTPNGKVDRRSLPPPAQALSRPGPTFIPPRTALEKTLVEIWAGLLQAPNEIGVEDDFFALGGHSLLAARVMSRLREQLQVDVGIQLLFQHPTIAGLAVAVARAQAAERPGQEIGPQMITPQPRRNAGAAIEIVSQLIGSPAPGDTAEETGTND